MPELRPVIAYSPEALDAFKLWRGALVAETTKRIDADIVAMIDGQVNATSTPPERFSPVTAVPNNGYFPREPLTVPASTRKSRRERKPTHAEPVVTAPSYERASFEPMRLKRVAHWAAQKAQELDAQAIVAIGHSGLIAAGAASILSDIPVFAVRKNGQEHQSHDYALVHGVARQGAVERWIFLDDFVSSGSTFRWAAQQVFSAKLTTTPLPIAILTYAGVDKRTEIPAWWEEIAPDWDGWSARAGMHIPTFGLSENAE